MSVNLGGVYIGKHSVLGFRGKDLSALLRLDKTILRPTNAFFALFSTLHLPAPSCLSRASFLRLLVLIAPLSAPLSFPLTLSLAPLATLLLLATPILSSTFTLSPSCASLAPLSLLYSFSPSCAPCYSLSLLLPPCLTCGHFKRNYPLETETGEYVKASIPKRDRCLNIHRLPACLGHSGD